MTFTTFDKSQTPQVLPLSGGTMTGNIAMGSNKITGLANGSATTDATAYGQIYYLQEPNQSVSNAPGFSTSSNTFQDTGVSVSIQPSLTTSKVRISVTGVIGSSVLGSVAELTITRGATDLSTSGSGFCQLTNPANQSIRVPCSINYLDSPNTTSSTTYHIKLRGDGTNTVIFTPATDAVIIVDEVR